MFNRENAVGFILLIVCAVIAGVMVYAITTGEQIRLDLPAPVGMALTVLFLGLLLFGLTRNLRGRRDSGGGRAWPDPQTGTRSLWDRIRGKK